MKRMKHFRFEGHYACNRICIAKEENMVSNENKVSCLRCLQVLAPALCQRCGKEMNKSKKHPCRILCKACKIKGTWLEHHITYAEKDGKDWTVWVKTGEHSILTRLQFLKSVSEGFLQALDFELQKKPVIKKEGEKHDGNGGNQENC